MPHEAEILCSRGKVRLDGRSEISRRPYSLVPGAAGQPRLETRSRDSRSTRSLEHPGRAVAACAVHSPELGPRYRLLYSPVGKPPASFRSIEAAASGGPLAFWLIRLETTRRLVDPPDATDRGHARVKLTMERLPESRVQLEITAEEEESAEAMRRAVRKVGNQITLPGFRKGKAPKAMIEQMYGPEVFLEEANRFLMSDLYRQALEREDLVPVGDPSVDISSNEPLSFTVVVPVYPEIDPGDVSATFASNRSTRPSTMPRSTSWSRRCASRTARGSIPQGEGLQVGAGLELTPKSRLPRDGDQVTIDYTVQEEGANVEEPVVDAVFVLGESGLLEPIEDAIKGLRVGETTGFSVPFAEDDESIDESLRGKTLSYSVTLKGLKERDLLPLDDDFAKTVGDVDTLDELRSNLREELHQTRTGEARREALAQIIEQDGGGRHDRAARADDRSRGRGRSAPSPRSAGAAGRPARGLLAGRRARPKTSCARRCARRRASGCAIRCCCAPSPSGKGSRSATTRSTRRSSECRSRRRRPNSPSKPKRSPAAITCASMLQSELFERQLTDRLDRDRDRGTGRGRQCVDGSGGRTDPSRPTAGARRPRPETKIGLRREADGAGGRRGDEARGRVGSVSADVSAAGWTTGR